VEHCAHLKNSSTSGSVLGFRLKFASDDLKLLPSLCHRQVEASLSSPLKAGGSTSKIGHQINCLYHLNDTWNSRVSGHGIRIVLYALVRLVTVVVLLK
jgi:hypothetical protein